METLQLPEIKTVETPYDEIKRNRERFIAALESGEYKQTYCNFFGPEGSMCFSGLEIHLNK